MERVLLETKRKNANLFNVNSSINTMENKAPVTMAKRKSNDNSLAVLDRQGKSKMILKY